MSRIVSSVRTKGELAQDKALNAFLYVIVILSILVCLYPVYFVIVASFSDVNIVNSGKLMLYPEGFHLSGYKAVFKNKDILTGYINTLLYTSCGTVIGLAGTFAAGYALSRDDMPGRGIIMKLMVFTMYFSGGLIPTYLVIKRLGLLNTRAVLIILGSISVYNIILVRSFCQSNISKELHEATKVDGCGDFRFFIQFAIPLSKAILAVIALYLAVGYWNSYYSALVYVSDYDKQPLQLVIRELLLAAQASNAGEGIGDGEAAGEYMRMIMVIKYAVIVVSTLPIMCVYPFLQKYFVKGVMIGSVKG